MGRMIVPFIDRKKELELLERITEYRPDALYVVYGPLNSGKSELMREFLKRKMRKGEKTYYLNFKLKSVLTYEDVVEALMEELKSKEIMEMVSNIMREGELVLTKWARLVGMSGAFNFWVKELRKHSNGNIPTVVFDSIEKIKHINGKNGTVFYELLNFAIGISKEEHIAHAFVVSSNSVLIDAIHTNPDLNAYVEYIKVDDLAREDVVEFLRHYGFNDEEIEKIWETFGGKPLLLIQCIKYKDELESYLKKAKTLRQDQVFQTLNLLRLRDETFFKEVMELLEGFSVRDYIIYSQIDDVVKWLAENNLIFVDPLDRKLRPHGRLDLLAIRYSLEQFERNGLK
ncbi:hypothetical protein IPA_09045 [Ignicoccus pacificus DSM 13166]|uniref:ATPase domain-containing protein n=1 Tax=Ignicoccus pacificus DSM 13166 TaxID=940294 RepID=A0A977PLD0_9CREN|nr:hypothetical protein IPA_09045 [Ignicoccus pacificus DSM 13166]